MPAEMSELFSNDARLTRLHELVNDHPDFELVPAPSADVYCFRYVPNNLADRQDEPELQRLLDQLNQEIAEAVRRGGMHLPTTVAIGKRVALCLSISRRTVPENVDATFEAVARWGRLLTRTHFNHETSREVEALPCSSEFCSSPTEVSAI